MQVFAICYPMKVKSKDRDTNFVDYLSLLNFADID